MVRKIGQIVRRGPSTWLVRIYVGRDPETRRRKYVGKFVHGGLRPRGRRISITLMGATGAGSLVSANSTETDFTASASRSLFFHS